MTRLRWSPSAAALRSAGVAALGLLIYPGLGAQSLPGPVDVIESDFADQVPGHVAIVDGAAFLEREGQRIRATENEPLFTGDRLRTDAGRLEVQFEDGSRLDFDEHTDLDFLSDTLVRLHSG